MNRERKHSLNMEKINLCCEIALEQNRYKTTIKPDSDHDCAL